MKKIILFNTILCAFFLDACDKIKDPIIKKSEVVGSNFITKDNLAISNFKKTLLEDYTGMKCPNCPDAAITAKNLSSIYTNSLIVLAVHAGSFAKPFGAYTADYRTNAGDVWNGNSGFGVISYPSGIINRKLYASNPLILSHTAWSSVVGLALADPMIIKLNVTTKYDTLVGALNTEISAIFKTTYTANVNISGIIMEDGIIGKQDVQGVETDDYEFEHVMRGAINGEWGTVLTNSVKNANDTVKVAFNNFNLKDLKYNCTSPPAIKPYTVNDKKVYVVVFAFNALTKEVLQVEKVKIR
jgi:hypothetical protein